jgi:predicted ribosome quality control (RQC) complex YloA/Tae2 family protein
MDIFVLKALVDELRQRLCGAVVSKVFQMSRDDLLLRLWRHQDLRLCCRRSSRPRLHLTTARFSNPPLRCVSPRSAGASDPGTVV